MAIRWRSGAPECDWHYGIDAPENGQLCRWNGKDYWFGWQTAALVSLLSNDGFFVLLCARLTVE